jgi:hypothetical protein
MNQARGLTLGAKVVKFGCNKCFGRNVAGKTLRREVLKANFYKLGITKNASTPFPAKKPNKMLTFEYKPAFA